MASVVGAYARAFADVVVKDKLDTARVLEELWTIDGLLRESVPLLRVLQNPSIPGDRKHAVLDALAKRLSLSRPVRNFVAVITDHRRLPLLADILRHVERELNDRTGIAVADVLSPRELDEAEKKLLESEVAKLTGKRVRARYHQDPSLLGGAVVKIGSTIYDGSVKGRLERIREQLVEG